MYIHRVILKNIKGFDELDIKFSRDSIDGDGRYAGWNVLTGSNGSGKTTVLKAIALALLGPETARALQSSFAGWISHGSDRATIAVQLLAGEGDAFDKGRPTTAPFFAELLLERRGDDVAILPGREFVKGKRSAINGPWSLGPGVWFAAAYGPFRRLYGTSTEAMRLMSSPGRPPRFATLFKEDATLGESQNWLQELQFKVLERRTKETELLRDITDLLNEDFLRHSLRVDHVDSDGLWLRNAQDISLSLTDMSDGYRSSLALLIDIARHLAVAYPHRPLVARSDGGKLIVPHHGVVLIDEIDAHLHPEWQRDIGFWLKQHFPNVQFIVSSHSAFVCQAADEMGIFTLDDVGASDARLAMADWQNIIAGTVDQVLLSPAFGLIHTRSPQAVNSRKEWSTLFAASKRAPLDEGKKARFEQLSLFTKDLLNTDSSE